ncbi:MAG: response regulator [Bacteroidia bacterium]
MNRPPKTKQIFIIIDDDPISIFLSRSVLQNEFAKATIIDFTSAERGLEFIREIGAGPGTPEILIFLDLNMPGLDGMGFLKLFGEFSDAVTSKVKIAILSSSISGHDIRQVTADKHVSLFVSKPLTAESIRNAMQSLNA